MKNLTTRALVVASLFAGAAFGSLSTGCFALWLGVAKADGPTGTLMTVTCSDTGPYGANGTMAPYAVVPFPGRDRYDLAANVFVTRTGEASSVGTVAGTPYLNGTTLLGTALGYADESVVVGCDVTKTAQLYVR